LLLSILIGFTFIFGCKLCCASDCAGISIMALATMAVVARNLDNRMVHSFASASMAIAADSDPDRKLLLFPMIPGLLSSELSFLRAVILQTEGALHFAFGSCVGLLDVADADTGASQDRLDAFFGFWPLAGLPGPDCHAAR
jgi:hypothetical protein